MLPSLVIYLPKKSLFDVARQDNNLFWGQFLNLATDQDPTSLYITWMRQFPDAPLIRYLTFANTEVLVVNSPAAYKEVLQSHCYSFTKPDPYVDWIQCAASTEKMIRVELIGL